MPGSELTKVGLKYFQDGEINLAESSWKKAVEEQADVSAMLYLSRFYRDERVAPQNFQLSFHYCVMAAAKNNGYALYDLGQMYLCGEVVQQNIRRAINCFKFAAQNEKISVQARSALGKAYYVLAEMYFYGEQGFSRNESEAYRYFLKALELGCKSALKNLAYMNFYGLGTDRNIALAVSYYKASAQDGDAYSQVSLGMLYLIGDFIGQDSQKAWQCFNDAAYQYHPVAFLRIGDMFFNGWYLPQDKQEALRHYQLAINHIGKYNGIAFEREIEQKIWDTECNLALVKASLECLNSGVSTNDERPNDDIVYVGTKSPGVIVVASTDSKPEEADKSSLSDKIVSKAPTVYSAQKRKSEEGSKASYAECFFKKAAALLQRDGDQRDSKLNVVFNWNSPS